MPGSCTPRSACLLFFLKLGTCYLLNGVNRDAAKLAFDEAIEEDGEPELLSTLDFDLALAYAEDDL